MIAPRIIRLVLACTLFLGMSVLPVYVAMAHQAPPSPVVEASHHKNLISVKLADDHSHDDGEDYERQAGHSHGHDPADHSHQAVFVGGAIFEDHTIVADRPFTTVSDVIVLETKFGIDRPPKAALPV